MKKAYKLARKAFVDAMNAPKDIPYMELANKLFDEYPVVGDRPKTNEDAGYVLHMMAFKWGLIR